MVDGVIVPMVTPTVGADGSLDTAAVREYTEMLVETDIDGLFPCGSIGEFSSLEPATQRRMIETVLDASKDVPVLAGCGGTSVDVVCDHIAAAATAGADAAVVVNPYYLATTQKGILRFFRRIADRASLPIILYNIPALCNQSIDVETVLELAALDGVVGIKDTSGNLSYCHRLIEETPHSFSLLQGSTQLAIASLDMGADGLVAGPANVFPGVMADIYASCHDNDRSTAIELMNSIIHPFLSQTNELPTASVLKHVLSVRGYDTGPPLPPLPELTDRQRDQLTDHYNELASRLAVTG